MSPNTKIVIGATAAIGAGAVTGYFAWRNRRLRNHMSVDEAAVPLYKQRLAILEEPKIDEPTRQLMAELAVHVYIMSQEPGEGAISRSDLRLRTIAATSYQFKQALGYLHGNHIIGLKKFESNPKSKGFAAAAALQWAMDSADCPAVLAEAAARYVGSQQNDAYYSFEDEM